MKNYTQGPWNVYRDGEEPNDGWPVVKFRDFTIMSLPMKGDSLGSQEADARLIAAAPELLEALKDLVELAENAMYLANKDGANYQDSELDAARYAILKAEGNKS